MSKQHKPSSEVTIRLGDLWGDLPRDVYKASKVLMGDFAKMMDDRDTERALTLAGHVYQAAYLQLLRAAFEQGRDSGGGPRGPRLPAGFTFADLLPHLSEARRALSAKGVPDAPRFEDWCQAHTWQGGMRAQPNTVRGWLTRYAPWIDQYDQRTLPREWCMHPGATP